MADPVVHFEVVGSDGPALHRFYADLFGWTIQDMGEEMGHYGTVDTGTATGIQGGIGASPDGSSAVTFYIQVEDPQAYLDRIESLGGSTVAPVMEIPGVVTFAQFSDPFGHVVGLVKGEPGEQPARADGDGVPVGWFELLGPKPDETLAFYEQVFGWKGRGGESNGFVYYEIDATNDGLGTFGGIGGTKDDPPAVNIYAGVDDVQAALDRAEELGGTKVVGPMKVSEETIIGLFTDPQGNTFGVYKR